MPLGLGLGISKIKSLVSGLRVRFQGNATITAALDGILRDLSADFVSNGTVTAALEAIKLLDVDFSGDGTLTGDLADYAYLLDDYSGAAVAYSIRLLSSTYSGALVRIRRSSDNAEKDFYPDSNNELSLSSEDGASTSLSSWIGANDGFVVTWYDQSGNSNNATQSTAANQPQIINAGALITQNGKAALQPDGTDDFMTFGSTLAANTYLINIVAGSITKGRFYSINTSYADFIEGNPNDRYRVNSNLYNSSTPFLDVQEIFNWQRASTDSKLFVNDSQIDSQTIVSDNFSVNQLFRVFGDFTTCADGLYQEVIQWNSDQSSNKTGINTNTNNFFSIY